MFDGLPVFSQIANRQSHAVILHFERGHPAAPDCYRETIVLATSGLALLSVDWCRMVLVSRERFR